MKKENSNIKSWTQIKDDVYGKKDHLAEMNLTVKLKHLKLDY